MKENTMIVLQERIFKYFSKEQFLIGASILRILFGANVLWLYLSNLAQREYIWGPNGIIPITLSRTGLTQVNQFSLYNLSSSDTYFNIIYFAGIVVTILYIFGAYPRILNILMYIFTYSLYNRNWMLLDGGNNILILELFYMMFVQTGAFFGIQARSIREKMERSRPSRWFVAMFHNMGVITIMLQVCLMYFISFIYKAHGNEWYSGTAIYYVLRVDEFRLPGVNELIYRNPLLVTTITYLTLLFQGSYPFLIWNKRTKFFMLFGAICFHLGIAIVMGLAWFSLSILSVDVIFINDTMYRAIQHYIEKALKQSVKFLRPHLKNTGLSLGRNLKKAFLLFPYFSKE
jgi:Vitamin K-dependent gamma-carboxylase